MRGCGWERRDFTDSRPAGAEGSRTPSRGRRVHTRQDAQLQLLAPEQQRRAAQRRAAQRSAAHLGSARPKGTCGPACYQRCCNPTRCSPERSGACWPLAPSPRSRRKRRRRRTPRAVAWCHLAGSGATNGESPRPPPARRRAAGRGLRGRPFPGGERREGRGGAHRRHPSAASGPSRIAPPAAEPPGPASGAEGRSEADNRGPTRRGRSGCRGDRSVGERYFLEQKSEGWSQPSAALEPPEGTALPRSCCARSSTEVTERRAGRGKAAPFCSGYGSDFSHF